MARLLLSALVLCLSLQPDAVAQVNNSRSQPLRIGLTDTFFSDVLKENRALNIYLPPGYDDSDTARYPVIYLLDGGMEEDFLPVTGLVHYASFPWVNYIQPSIIIGIVNTDRKRDFTTPPATDADRKIIPKSGGSAAFIRFLAAELQPHIAGHYRVSSQRTLIGESLGGLLASNVLLHQPDLFDRYIIISPSLWWNDGALLREKINPLPTKPIAASISVGKEGATPGDKPRIMEKDAAQFAEQLKEVNMPNLQVRFNYLPAETHATISQPALLNAFRALK